MKLPVVWILFLTASNFVNQLPAFSQPIIPAPNQTEEGKPPIEIMIGGGRFLVSALRVSFMPDPEEASARKWILKAQFKVLNQSKEDWQAMDLYLDVYRDSGKLMLPDEGGQHSLDLKVAAIRSGEEQSVTASGTISARSRPRVTRIELHSAPGYAGAKLLRNRTGSGFLAVDKRCAEEFMTVSSAETGQVGQERINDLVNYGCVSQLDLPTHAEVIEQSPVLSKVVLLDGEMAGRTGWIPTAWLRE